MTSHTKVNSRGAFVMLTGLLLPPIIAAAYPAHHSVTADKSGETDFRREIEPLFKRYCYSCHAGGVKSGGVVFDEYKSYASLQEDRPLFRKVLKNLRSSIMPPARMDQPTDAEKRRIAEWIKTCVYLIDPASPNPGHVTTRRLNRVEYRNTIRDLIGVDYDTQTEFPADDAGHGFDNVGDALTLSSLLMEKYLNAAQAVVAQAVPAASKVVAETQISGSSFVRDGESASTDKPTGFRVMSYYEPAIVSHTVQIEHPGSYQLILELSADERYVDNKFDYNRCRLIVRADGQELFRKEFNREGGKLLHYVFDQKWQTGGMASHSRCSPSRPAWSRSAR